ncbi:sugar phosphate nucleotidyltransferase [Hippea alviniae]|uniref:sugar phosphate nucleotidyltransferase n=1 Tax=Hippea alviniae TaxID=1279027 RepID=UPI0003B6F383|nr:sugar phosphate nucleotidyltransferase [Hippea alviniae]
MKCLIIAAGKGSRLQHKGSPKPLVKLLGLSLIERVIHSCRQAGVDDFFVVVGNQADKLVPFLKKLSEKLNVPITPIYNDKWDKYENGYSVFVAKDYINEPFLLSMSDHIVEADIVKRLINCAKKYEDAVLSLAVDTRLDNPYIDFDDVTKVKLNGESITDIGKKLSQFDGYDTGLFYLKPDVFDALKEAIDSGDSSLSAAVKLLGKQKKAKACLIEDGFWIDVDTEEAYKKCESYLLKSLKKKTDGPISYYLNRPISTFITRLLVNTNITPNQITIFSFLLSIFGSYLISIGSYLWLVIGGFVVQLSSIIDGCDGEIARLKFLSSDYGAWLDRSLDRYSDGFLIMGLTLYLFKNDHSILNIIVGFLALIGSFMVSYTAIKYDEMLKKREKRTFRIGRDLRIFIIFLGSLLNQLFLTLTLIAVIMNLESVRRIVIKY